jgi:hypothetical protein
VQRVWRGAVWAVWHLHIFHRVDRDTRHPDITRHPFVIGIVPTVSGQVKCHTETLLPCREVLSIELVALLDRAESSVLCVAPATLVCASVCTKSELQTAVGASGQACNHGRVGLCALFKNTHLHGKTGTYLTNRPGTVGVHGRFGPARVRILSWQLGFPLQCWECRDVTWCGVVWCGEMEEGRADGSLSESSSTHTPIIRHSRGESKYSVHYTNGDSRLMHRLWCRRV